MSEGSEDPSPTTARETPVFQVLRDYSGALRTRWRSLRMETRILGVAWAVFVVATVFFSYQRYETYQTNAWDLGINMQALWTTAYQGRLLYYTAELSWNSSGSLLGVHFNAFLFALVPVYRVFPGALTLFLLQSAAVGASALPLYLLSRRRTSAPASLAISLAYLVSAPLLGGLFYDFHSEAFIPLFGLTVWYAWETRRPRLLALSAVALLSVIELSPLILGAMALMFLLGGLWSWKVTRSATDRASLRWAVVLPLITLTVCAVLTPIWFAVPKLISPSTPPYTQAGVLGGGLSQIIVNLFDPHLVAEALSTNLHAKLVYLFVMLLAGMVLWTLRPLQILPAVPWIFVAMLSSITGYLMPAGDQYTFLAFPFLLPATASGYALLSRHIAKLRTVHSPVSRPRRNGRFRVASRLRRRVVGDPATAVRAVLLCGILVGFAFTQVQWSPLSPSSQSWENVYRAPSAHTQMLDRVTQLVPPTVSISVEPDLFPQFADRAGAYPYIVAEVDYILYDTTSWWFTTPLPPPTTNPPWSDEVDNLSGPYGVLASADGIVLLESGYIGPPAIFVPLVASLVPGSFFLPNATLVVSPQAPLGGYIVPDRATNAYLWYGPYVFMVPGVYHLDVWLRSTDPTGGSVILRVTLDLGATIVSESVVSPTQIGSNWTEVHWNVTIPHPGYLEFQGHSTGSPAGLDFGGLTVAQQQLPSLSD